MLPPRVDVLVPFWGLAGGVIKVLDYADHATQLGIDVFLWAPPVPDSSDLAMTLPVVERLLNSNRVTIRPIEELALTPESMVLFTEVGHHTLIERATREPLGANLIHLVQGTRHANPLWNDGLNYRLLHRPMTRIAVTDVVAEALAPIVNTEHRTVTIREGHDWPYFTGRPAPRDVAVTRPIRLLYTTWKSDLGERIAERITNSNADQAIACIGVTTELGWPTLRNRYHGADVFVCTPGPEEGFYLPGLEAMAAGVAVVTALVGGNADYVRADQNALVVPYDDVDAHVDAIERLANDPALIARLVDAGSQTVLDHTLGNEREAFADLLGALGASS